MLSCYAKGRGCQMRRGPVGTLPVYYRAARFGRAMTCRCTLCYNAQTTTVSYQLRLHACCFYPACERSLTQRQATAEQGIIYAQGDRTMLDKQNLVAPPIPRRYEWLRIVATVYLILGVLALPATLLLAVFVAQYNLMEGLITVFGGFLLASLLCVVGETLQVLLSIEENTRRANGMGRYIMQTTHNLTAIHNAMEEIASNMLYATNQMKGVSTEVRGLTGQLKELAEYSRTTAILLHRQTSNTGSYQYREVNGSE